MQCYLNSLRVSGLEKETSPLEYSHFSASLTRPHGSPDRGGRGGEWG